VTASVPWAYLAAVAVGAAIGGTLLVNCAGGLMIGLALAWFQRMPNEFLRLLLVTGFLGGLTTFSSFTGESLLLLQRGEYALAFGHTAAHMLGSLALAAVGFRAMRSIIG
jgi:CrcB protein